MCTLTVGVREHNLILVLDCIRVSQHALSVPDLTTELRTLLSRHSIPPKNIFFCHYRRFDSGLVGTRSSKVLDERLPATPSRSLESFDSLPFRVPISNVTTLTDSYAVSPTP